MNIRLSGHLAILVLGVILGACATPPGAVRFQGDSLLKPDQVQFSRALGMAVAVGAQGCGGLITIAGDLSSLKQASVVEVWTVSGCGKQKNLKVEITPGAGFVIGEISSDLNDQGAAKSSGEYFKADSQVTNAIGRFKPLVASAKGFHPRGFGHPYWLDNHRILVNARRLKPGANDDSQWDSYEASPLVIWDIEANTFTPTNIPISEYVVDCFNSDTHYIQIPTKRNRTEFPYLHGTLEFGLDEYKRIDYVTPSNNRYINPYSCRDYLGTSNKLVPGQVSDPLLESHGMLHFDIAKDVTYKGWFVLRLTTPRNQTVEFEMTKAEYHFAPPFLVTAQAYLFAGRLYRRGELSKDEIESNAKKQDTFSLLSPFPPFAIKYLPIPPQLIQIGARNVGGKFMYPSLLKTGAILWHYQPMEIPERGTYMQEGERLSKILDGHQGDARVSPDGCKLAYGYRSGRYMSRTHNPSDSYRLEVIDFCKTKE